MHSSLARRAWPMLCVTITIVNFSRRPSISGSIAVVPSASSAEQGSSIRMTLRLERQQPGDAQLLLLLEGEAVAFRCKAVLDVVPERHFGQRRLDELVELRRVRPPVRVVHPHAEQDVLVDRDRQRVGPLKHHAHRLAQLAEADVGIVDVLARGS